MSLSFAALLAVTASVFTACSKDNDDNTAAAQEYTGVPLVILDTDIGSSTDNLFTLTERGIVALKVKQLLCLQLEKLPLSAEHALEKVSF